MGLVLNHKALGARQRDMDCRIHQWMLGRMINEVEFEGPYDIQSIIIRTKITDRRQTSVST